MIDGRRFLILFEKGQKNDEGQKIALGCSGLVFRLDCSRVVLLDLYLLSSGLSLKQFQTQLQFKYNGGQARIRTQ